MVFAACARACVCVRVSVCPCVTPSCLLIRTHICSSQVLRTLLVDASKDENAILPLPLLFLPLHGNLKEQLIWRRMGLGTPRFHFNLDKNPTDRGDLTSDREFFIFITNRRNCHGNRLRLRFPVAVTPMFVALTRVDSCPGMTAALSELLPVLYKDDALWMFLLKLALYNMIELGQVTAVKLLSGMITKLDRNFDPSVPCFIDEQSRFSSLFADLSARLKGENNLTFTTQWSPIMLAVAHHHGNLHHKLSGRVATPVDKALYKVLVECSVSNLHGFNPDCTEPAHGRSLLQCLFHRQMFEEAYELITIHGADVSSSPGCRDNLQLSAELEAPRSRTQFRVRRAQRRVRARRQLDQYRMHGKAFELIEEADLRSGPFCDNLRLRAELAAPLLDIPLRVSLPCGPNPDSQLCNHNYPQSMY